VLVLTLHNRTRRPMRIEQLRPLVAPSGYRGLPLEQLRISQTGWQSWSVAHLPLSFAPNAESAPPPIRSPSLPHRALAGEVVPWMATLHAEDRQALLIGFTQANHYVGSIDIIPRTDGSHSLRVASELEGRTLQPGEAVSSEPLMLALGDADALQTAYADAVASRMRARSVARVPTGWCSWYQLATRVTEADVRRNLAAIAARRDLLPIDLVQLDDGYQHEVGDWLDLKATFPSGMPALAAEMRGLGFTPGLWLAPFLVSARSRLFAEHPEWVVRGERGDALNAIDNWGCANYALDTTRPEAMVWLEHVVRTMCTTWGFEYLKLDFVYAAALRGQRHDPTVSSVEAYRRGMDLVRGVADDRFLLGCGAPLLPSVGLVDGMRIGSDVAHWWRRPDDGPGPGLGNAMRATLARGWLHRRWWVNDPDCVLVRASDTQLTLEEVKAWAAVVALSGGMVMLGDDVSRLPDERVRLLSRLLPPLGVAADSAPPIVDGMPERLHLRIERAWDEWSIVGMGNWSPAPTRLVFDPTEWAALPPRYYAVDLWTGEHLGPLTGRVHLGAAPPHSLRLLSIHDAGGDRPRVIGSTGHLLGEAVDVAEVTADEGLTVHLAASGPPGGHGTLLVAMPDDTVRRVPFQRGRAATITVR
jgi:alpha-galactosidase